MTRPKGFLLVTMEPPPALEEEFNDWYDSEHLPERQAVPGFETATRFVAVAGWPRYLAFYDLRDAQVIEEPGYQAIAGENFSPWTKRILLRVRGLYRAYGEQIYPGHRLQGAAARLLFIRFHNLPRVKEQQLVVMTRQQFEQRPGVHQLRIFRCTENVASDYLALVEMMSPLMGLAFDGAAYGDIAVHIDAVNEYVPYGGRVAIAGVLQP